VNCDEILMSDGNVEKWCCGVSMVPVFFTSVILFALSFDTLDPHQVGIRYNNNLKTLDENRVYNNGRYFIGVGLSFIEFPITAELIEFRYGGALRMWTNEGQLVLVDLSLMYRLERHNIIKLYKRYKEDYKSRYKQIIVRACKKVSIQYTAEDFFTKRNLVGTHMRSELRRRMKQEFATLEIFNLRKIDIPAKFEQKVVEKQIVQQGKQTRIYQKETAVKRAEITIRQQVALAVVHLKIENATAIRDQRIEKAKAEALLAVALQEAKSYNDVQTELDVPGNMILKYRFSQMMESLDVDGKSRNVQYFIGLKKKMLSMY